MQIQLPENVDLRSIPEIVKEIDHHLKSPVNKQLNVDFSRVRHCSLSSFGMLLRLKKRCIAQDISLQFLNIDPAFQEMIRYTEIDDLERTPESLPEVRGFFEKIGRTIIWYLQEVVEVLEFVGRTCTRLFKHLLLPHRIHWKDTAYYVETAGVNAIPIVGLISLLLGMIIAFQASGQLQNFGANIFVVELVALSMTRELAPLITAIIVAGRSGSAFTAEIGAMQVSEEVDAMKVMGLDLTDYLVAPKVWALLISLPLLAFWADIASLAGGALIAGASLDVEFVHFVTRLQEKLALRHVLIGIGKCFVFAAIITLIGCYRGFKVSNSASSVGQQTTASVVMSIFFVIVADAGLSVVLTLLRI